MKNKKKTDAISDDLMKIVYIVTICVNLVVLAGCLFDMFSDHPRNVSPVVFMVYVLLVIGYTASGLSDLNEKIERKKKRQTKKAEEKITTI